VVQRLIADYTCIVPYTDADRWQSLQRKINNDYLHGVEADLAVESEVNQFAAKLQAEHGPLYGIVHLVGGFSGGSVADTAPAEWERMLMLLLSRAFLVLHTFVPQLRERGEGRIITIGSAAVATRPSGIVAYNVAKVGLNTLTDTLANELKGTRITANTLLPGSLATGPMLESMPREKLVPLEYVANAIAFLLSTEAAGITGASIPITVTGTS
jgi:NAD(P)-dependent dehydrogenase (short-subunit alcohol dehydrogenase family)